MAGRRPARSGSRQCGPGREQHVFPSISTIAPTTGQGPRRHRQQIVLPAPQQGTVKRFFQTDRSTVGVGLRGQATCVLRSNRRNFGVDLKLSADATTLPRRRWAGCAEDDKEMPSSFGIRRTSTIWPRNELSLLARTNSESGNETRYVSTSVAPTGASLALSASC